MSLKFGRLACPKRTETVARLDWDVSILTLEGGIPQWAGGGGSINADFVNNPGPSPRSAYGPIKLRDGSGAIILDVPNALIQAEQGENDPGWPGKTWGNFRAEGVDTEGHPYAFRLGEQNPEDSTSLIVDFALSGGIGVAAFQEVKVWAGTVMPVSGASDFGPLLDAWITAQGINVAGLAAFVRKLGGKAHAPDAAERVVAWINDNVVGALDPQKVLAIAMIALAEMKSGAPGYNPQHGGTA